MLTQISAPVRSPQVFPELRLGGSASTSCSSSQKATNVLTTLVNLWLASRLDELALQIR
jgi:hypothetical protein